MKGMEEKVHENSAVPSKARKQALGLSLTMMVSIMGCGKQQRLDAEINPDTPVSDVQFPLKETELKLWEEKTGQTGLMH